MYKKLVSALYVLNIVFQAFYTLALPIGIGALISFLLTKYTSIGGWIWAVLIILGVMTGLVSMVRFILSSMAALERLENQRDDKKTDKTGKNNEK